LFYYKNLNFRLGEQNISETNQMLSLSQLQFSTKLLIDGEFFEGEGRIETIYAPATGEVISQVREASMEQVNHAVAAAKRAYPSWSRTTPQQRSTVLLEIANLIENHAPNLARIEALNCGKPLHQALNDDLTAAVDVFRFFAGAVRCQHGQLSAEYIPGYTSMVRRDALGVVAAIAPWNYPLMMAAWKIAPALAAGNTLVFKPSEHTPLSIFELVSRLVN
jgi:betaine-aldehyde dehydrogenase/aminobutyraldehyde dehydrogenase